MAPMDDLLRDLERLQGPLRWVSVQGREDSGVILDDRNVLVGGHREIKVLFPKTGEVALYAQIAVSYPSS